MKYFVYKSLNSVFAAQFIKFLSKLHFGKNQSMKFETFVTIFATLFLVEAQVSLHNENYCYSTDPIRPQNGMHTIQSSYESIRRPGINPGVSSKFISCQ